jgi:hypothetical protein
MFKVVLKRPTRCLGLKLDRRERIAAMSAISLSADHAGRRGRVEAPAVLVPHAGAGDEPRGVTAGLGVN